MGDVTQAMPVEAETDDERPIELLVHRPLGDRIYRAVARTAGISTLLLMAAIGFFLLQRSLPALRVAGFGFLTNKQWNPGFGHFGVLAVLAGTVSIALVALVIAVPISVGMALYITEYAPRSIRRVLTVFVDLLAAVPSIIYGIWGKFFLQSRLIGPASWISRHLGFIPLFKATTPDFTASTFIAGVIVSLMVVPICTSVMREVFSQTPVGEKEAALALGGSRSGMIRTVVFPFGRAGMIGGSMLGLGRALGETVAVTLIISPIFYPTSHILQTGGISFASLIALRYGESNQFQLDALMAAGLALFVLTLLVNVAAAVIVNRSRSGAATEL